MGCSLIWLMVGMMLVFFMVCFRCGMRKLEMLMLCVSLVLCSLISFVNVWM